MIAFDCKLQFQALLALTGISFASIFVFPGGWGGFGSGFFGLPSSTIVVSFIAPAGIRLGGGPTGSGGFVARAGGS